MTNPQDRTVRPPQPRRLACARCGTEFGCDLSGQCWCAEESAKLPMPVEGGDCLCRDCLRKAAEAGSPDGAQADSGLRR